MVGKYLGNGPNIKIEIYSLTFMKVNQASSCMPLTKAIRSTFWGAFDLDIPDRVLLYGDDYLSTYTLLSNKKRSFPKPKTFLQPQIKARVPFPKNQMTTHH